MCQETRCVCVRVCVYVDLRVIINEIFFDEITQGLACDKRSQSNFRKNIYDLFTLTFNATRIL